MLYTQTTHCTIFTTIFYNNLLIEKNLHVSITGLHLLGFMQQNGSHDLIRTGLSFANGIRLWNMEYGIKIDR